MRQISLAVVGVDYANRKKKERGAINRRFEVAACAPGETVDLILEPDNPADPNAVMVFSARGVQIGYLRAERAPLISKHIRQGGEAVAVFQAPAKWGAWIRVSLDGSDPVLPTPREELDDAHRGEDDIGFYPDPIWDEDA